MTAFLVAEGRLPHLKCGGRAAAWRPPQHPPPVNLDRLCPSNSPWMRARLTSCSLAEAVTVKLSGNFKSNQASRRPRGRFIGV